MTYQQVLENARTCIGPYCKACNDCNGKVCRNTMPGPGAKGEGTGFIRNAEKWREICVNMDTICENSPVDTSFTLFGRTFEIPAFAAPVGAMRLHYGDKYDDLTYNDILVRACANAGILAFTGDGTDPKVVEGAAEALKANGGCGVPTIKPWDMDTIREKFALVQESEPFAIAMDIDAAGLPFLQGLTPPAGSKSVEELKQIVSWAQRPFILKGIMTARGAEKALEAGASGIVVSNHGGRVLGQTPASAEVPRDGGGASGHRRCRRRQDDDFCRRRDPQRHGHVQGAGARCGRGAHRPPVCYHRLWRRGGGRAALRPEAQSRACRHDAHVRRALARGH